MNGQPNPSRNAGGESYWNSLSEVQLLQTAFTTSDPEGLPGVVENVPPPTDQPPIVEYWYDFRGTKRQSMIRCVHCRYHNHFAGYVLKTAEGERFLVGHECGSKLYGARFEELRRDYDDAREHASNLRRWNNLQSALPSFLDWLSDLQCCEPVRTYRETKTAFRAELPRLYGAISVALNRDRGVLSLQEKLRDFEAENRAVDRFEEAKKNWDGLTTTERKNRRRFDGEKPPQPPQLPIFKFVPRAVMTVRADKFFSDRTLPHEQLGRALAAFQDLAAEIAGATLRSAAYEAHRDDRFRNRRHLFASTFKGVFNRVSTLLDVVRAAVEEMADMEVFFRPDSIATVVQWANAHPKITENFAMRGRGIASAGALVSLPNSFAPPSIEPVEKFIKAMNATLSA
jgi:hypothetical protein